MVNAAVGIQDPIIIGWSGGQFPYPVFVMKGGDPKAGNKDKYGAQAKKGLEGKLPPSPSALCPVEKSIDADNAQEEIKAIGLGQVHARAQEAGPERVGIKITRQQLMQEAEHQEQGQEIGRNEIEMNDEELGGGAHHQAIPGQP